MSLEPGAKRPGSEFSFPIRFRLLGADQREANRAPERQLGFCLLGRFWFFGLDLAEDCELPADQREASQFGSCATPPVKALEEFAFGLLHRFGRLQIGLGRGRPLQFPQRQSGF